MDYRLLNIIKRDVYKVLSLKAQTYTALYAKTDAKFFTADGITTGRIFEFFYFSYTVKKYAQAFRVQMIPGFRNSIWFRMIHIISYMISVNFPWVLMDDFKEFQRIPNDFEAILSRRGSWMQS